MSESGFIYNDDPFVPAIVLDNADSRLGLGGGSVSSDSARLVVSPAPGGEFAICLVPLGSGGIAGIEFRNIYNQQIGQVIATEDRIEIRTNSGSIAITSYGVVSINGKNVTPGAPDSGGIGYRLLRVPN